MTNEDLTSRIQNGDRELLPELWAKVEKFVWMVAGKKVAESGGSYYGMEREDLYDAGYIALVKAVDGYDTEKGAFLQFLYLCLKNVWSESAGVRSEKQRKDPLINCISLDEPIGDDSDGGSKVDFIQDTRDEISEVEDRIFVEQLRAVLEEAISITLTPAEQYVIRQKYFENRTQKSISEQLGASQERISAMHKEAIHKLRRSRYNRALKEFAQQTNFYLHVSVKRFNSTMTSAVEEIVLRQEAWMHKYMRL